MLTAGQFVLRLVIPIWGFFAGFAFGAGMVSAFADEHFLGTVLGWVLGLVFALIFAILAYVHYYFAVVLAMGAAARDRLGHHRGLRDRLELGGGPGGPGPRPRLRPRRGLHERADDHAGHRGLIAGAVGVTGGFMLLVGSLDSSDFSRGDFTDTVSNSFGWSLLFLVLAVGGIAIQALQRALMRQSIRETWYAEV